MKSFKYLFLIILFLTFFVSAPLVNAAENETFYSKVILGRFADDEWVQVGSKTSNTNELLLNSIYEGYYYPIWLGFYGNASNNFTADKIYNLSFKVSYPSGYYFDWKKAMQYAKMEVTVDNIVVNYCTMNSNTTTSSEFTCEFKVSQNGGSYYEINVNWWDTNLSRLDLGFLLDSMPETLKFDLSLTSNTDYGGQVVSQNEVIIGQNQQIIQNGNVTNDKLDDIQNSITDESSPDTSGLSNAAGWLPPGPLDNLLNLPLSMFNAISRDLSSTCSPVKLPLPYINENLTLPCMSSFYEGIKINSFMDWIGIIASGLMLYSYLMKLYKWVDDTLTFRENNHQDWGGV